VSPLAAVLCLLALVGPTVAALVLWRGLRERRALVPLTRAPLETPLLVVIPARNEASRLPRTLDLLLADPSPQLAVVVVDDASTDGTAAVVTERARRDPRLTLRRPSWPPTTDVFGKPRALDDAIRGDPQGHALILCLDADVHLQPGALGGLVTALEHHGADALSVMPTLDDVTFAERALVPAFVAAVAGSYPPSAVHDLQRPEAFLNGQVMLLRRSALDDVGGFASVSHTVLEDVALAGRLKAAGHRLRLIDGDGLVATRMYANVAEIVAGFGKNALALHGRRLVGLALLLTTVAWLPWLCLGAAMLVPGDLDDVVCLGALLATVGCSALNRRTLRSSPWLALLSPIVMSVVGGVYLRAALVRRATWRGRTFPTRAG